MAKANASKKFNKDCFLRGHRAVFGRKLNKSFLFFYEETVFINKYISYKISNIITLYSNFILDISKINYSIVSVLIK